MPIIKNLNSYIYFKKQNEDMDEIYKYILGLNQIPEDNLMFISSPIYCDCIHIGRNPSMEYSLIFDLSTRVNYKKINPLGSLEELLQVYALNT